MTEILVFGSCFLDYIAYSDRIPNPGETLTSTSFQKGFGGKGANQAVAAARLLPPASGNVANISVAMAGCVGSDGDGAEYVDNLKSAGCDVSRMRKLKGESTGIALIAVDKKGTNAIVICPNAAGKTRFTEGDGGVTPSSETKLTNNDDTFGASDLFAATKAHKGGIFICQNEIPLASTLSALKAAFETGRYYTIFNPAPAPATKEQIQQVLPYLKYISLICPNEHEALLMTGVKVTDAASAGQAIAVLQNQFGARDVIITLGAQGCAIRGNNNNNNNINKKNNNKKYRETAATIVKAPKVNAVDTTGAGDCFVGSLAYFLAGYVAASAAIDIPESVLVQACGKANVIAAMSVTKKGTQSSYHTRDQLPKELFESFSVSKL